MRTPATAPDLAEQTRSLVANAYAWLRNDSLEALVAVGAATVLFVALRALRSLACRLLERPAHPARWRTVAANVARRTHGFFLAALSADLVANVVAPPGGLLTIVDFIFTIAAVVQGAMWIRELILVVIVYRAERGDPDHSTLSNAMGVIRILVNVVIWAIALILVLDNLGVNVTALVAGLGIGGIAIGLAAQGIFSDLFAALAIIFDRPFRRGDTIQYGTTIGTVEAIGLKTTRLRALSGEQVVMANTKLLEQEVRNLRLVEERRVALMLPIRPNTEADRLARIPELVRAVVEAQPLARFDRALLVGVNGNSIDVELVFIMATPDADAMLTTRHVVLLETMRVLHDAGIQFADLTPPRG